MLEHGDKAMPIPEGTRVPASIGRAVLRGLDRDKAKRFPSMAALIAELTPPPARSPVRYAAFALGAVVLAGIATAGVMGRPAREVPQALDGQGVGPLIEQINRLHGQITELDRERHVLMKELERHIADEHELSDLKTRLAAKDEQIQQLITTVSQLQANHRNPVAAKPKVPSQEFQTTAAVDTAHAAVEGCFDEWWEREPSATDAAVVVRLTVTPDGIGNSATVTGPDSEILKLCVSEQIAAVHFPAGPQQLDLEVYAQWSAGLVNLSARVTGRHEGPRGRLDLD
jgi:hypothetical protein